jgi:hypothetical protein
MIDHLRKRATRRHKSNHLALEVKTFFGTSTPVTGSSTESSTQGIDFPLTAVNGIAKRERERKKPTHNNDTTRAKLEQLCSARLICRDLRVTKLDIQKIQR